MLDTGLKTQLHDYLQRVTRPIEIVAWLDDSETARELQSLLRDIASLSEHITFVEEDAAGETGGSIKDGAASERRPSFGLRRPGEAVGIRFAGVPMGHEFTSLVLALLQVGGHPLKLAEDVFEQVRGIEGELRFETYISLTCQVCPDVVQALNAMAVINPRIRHVMIDGALFQNEIEQRHIQAVPTVYLNGKEFTQGRITLPEVVAKLDSGAAQREAAKIDAQAPYEVLIVGGGPAGAAAAIYAARKGIRTGVVAERFGGQVLDTLGIENFVSIISTEGPQFATALEEHVRNHEVDIMNLQRAAALSPASMSGAGAAGSSHGTAAGANLIEIKLESGATLRSRSVVIATGARWRNINVPGEAQYRNHGVAYCPHCDGPLFKGKRVAVVGGGNSGVEAAIDLAGIVAHVTLIEFDPKLRADEVLQRKLRSLPNVTVAINAQTTEITGDGHKVDGLLYKDRASGEIHRVDLEGVFVQIGLVPNTEWLKGSPVKLSPRGEIEIDARGQTSLPGVFAAGDVTTVPYKQIVIAVGEGATAALSAFDHLIRSPITEAMPQTAAA